MWLEILNFTLQMKIIIKRQRNNRKKLYAKPTQKRRDNETNIEALNHQQQKIIEIKDKFGDIEMRCLLTEDKYLTT